MSERRFLKNIYADASKTVSNLCHRFMLLLALAWILVKEERLLLAVNVIQRTEILTQDWSALEE